MFYLSLGRKMADSRVFILNFLCLTTEAVWIEPFKNDCERKSESNCNEIRWHFG